ncbi:MAG: hypothetical protein GXP43_01340 [bacterium]|nr:hypothetical protein [bacterium]
MVNRLIRFIWRRRDYEVIHISLIFLVSVLAMVAVILPPLKKPVNPALPIPYYSIVNTLLVSLSLWLLYYYLFLRLVGKDPLLPLSKKITYIRALFLSSLWVGWIGEAIHFTADTIGNFLNHNPNDPAWRIAYFLDEILGHIMAYFAIFIMGILGVMLEMQYKSSQLGKRGIATISFIGFLTGIGWSVALIEGEAAKTFLPLMIIFSGAVILWAGLRKWSISHKPWSLFLLIVNLVAIIFTLAWGIYWRGFPQFSDLGLI